MTAEQIMEAAVQAAKALLPSLEKRVQELQAEISTVQTHIRHLNLLVSTVSKDEPTSKGAGVDVAQTLGVASEAMTVVQIKDKIKETTGRVYATSTIYGVLGVLVRAGSAASEGNKWRATRNES